MMNVTVLKQNITESYDETMDSFLSSDEYNRKVFAANKLFAALRKELSSDQQYKLDSVLTAFDEIAREEAKEALFRGFLGLKELEKNL